MATIAKRVTLRAKQFRESAKPETWKADHDEAMRVLDLEHLVQVGISLWDYFGKTLDAWTEDVEEGRTTYDPVVEQTFDAARRSWLQTSLAIEKMARAFEKKGYTLEHIEKFRDSINCAHFILADVEELHRRFPQIEKARKEAVANAKARRENAKKS